MDVSAIDGFRQRPAWLAVIAVLLIGQGWLTLRLFTPDLDLGRLVSDEPIVSGRHPLHFYHGMIAARTWEERGTSSCFDPTYQAGYPKTPVFDGGSRPAEFFQLLGGTRPASYKIGIVICCLLAPLLFCGMGRGIGLTPAASCVGALLGCVLWWSPPCLSLIIDGDIDLLLGGLCTLMHLTWFVRFERLPGIDSWCVMTLFATLGWYTQPLLIVASLPFLLLYYLWVAARQGPIWHLAVVSEIFVAFGVNYGWLNDWARNLWLYLPCGGALPPSAPFWPTMKQQWSHLLPPSAIHIGIGAVGLIGLLAMLKCNRAASWLLGASTLQYVLTGAAGKFWPVLTEFGTDKLLFFASWFLVLPAALVLTSIASHMSNASGWRPAGFFWLVVGLSGLAWSMDMPRRWLSQPGLEIGLNEERAALVKTLVDRTTPDARILWEDRGGGGQGWSALIGVFTERSFLGGLDPDGRVEHMYARLSNGKLGGKPVADWDDARLRRFIERYNVGWIVCWTPESIQRFRALPEAKAIADVKDGDAGVLFALDRKRTFFLKGRGKWVQADWQRIALADVVPVDGEIVLSMHYQSKMRVAPFYVQFERELDLDDPIPLIRLRVPGPIARLSIVWDNP